MKKIIAIALFLAFATPAAAQLFAPQPYPAKFESAIDGDTYVLEIQLPFEEVVHRTIRLDGIDCAERNTIDGKIVRMLVDQILRSGKLTVVSSGYKSFDRHVAHVYVDGNSLADRLSTVKNEHGTLVCPSVKH